MFISIRELQLHQIRFQEEFRPEQIDLGPEVRQKTPLRTSGRADLLPEHHGRHKHIDDIRLVGEFSTRLEFSCARCLEPIARDVERSFDLLYRPQGSDAGHEELSVAQAEADIGYYTGDGLLLEDVLREQVLLAVPLKAVCREECRGLCPHCGRNLNLESCDCAESPGDPHWSALAKLKEKLPGSNL
jgi:DUF177 domain-containing protein